MALLFRSAARRVHAVGFRAISCKAKADPAVVRAHQQIASQELGALKTKRRNIAEDADAALNDYESRLAFFESRPMQSDYVQDQIHGLEQKRRVLSKIQALQLEKVEQDIKLVIERRELLSLLTCGVAHFDPRLLR